MDTDLVQEGVQEGRGLGRKHRHTVGMRWQMEMISLKWE